MANRNPRFRWIAAIVVALGLFASIAWWRWPGSRANETQSTRMDVANPSQAAVSESVVERAGSSKQTAVDADDGDDDSAEQACHRDYKAAVRDYRVQLGPARNADEAIDRLLLGTLAADPGDWMSGAIGSGYREARKRWPDDVELAWLALDHCGPGCDQHAEARHLLAVDPDNAAAWMVAMAAARSDHDEQGFAYALRRAASAKIYDSRMGIVFLRSRAVLARVPVPDSCRTPQARAAMRGNAGREATDGDRIDLMASSLEAAIGTPSFSGLVECIPKATPLPETWRRPCSTLLSRVAQGDTLIERTIAVRGLLALENDPARLAQLRERYRQLRWLQTVGFGEPLPEHYATRMWAQGEVATLQALAIERGRWPPPSDWLPDDPRARALILGEDPVDPGRPGHP